MHNAFASLCASEGFAPSCLKILSPRRALVRFRIIFASGQSRGVTTSVPLIRNCSQLRNITALNHLLAGNSLKSLRLFQDFARLHDAFKLRGLSRCLIYEEDVLPPFGILKSAVIPLYPSFRLSIFIADIYLVCY